MSLPCTLRKGGSCRIDNFFSTQLTQSLYGNLFRILSHTKSKHSHCWNPYSESKLFFYSNPFHFCGTVWLISLERTLENVSLYQWAQLRDCYKDGQQKVCDASVDRFSNEKLQVSLKLFYFLFATSKVEMRLLVAVFTGKGGSRRKSRWPSCPWLLFRFSFQPLALTNIFKYYTYVAVFLNWVPVILRSADWAQRGKQIIRKKQSCYYSFPLSDFIQLFSETFLNYLAYGTIQNSGCIA